MNGNNMSYVVIAGRRIHYAWIILVGCCFVQAGGAGTILLSAGVYYVPICTDLGFARYEISLWMTAYFVATIPATPLASKILERFDVRRPMSVSICVICCAIALMGTYTEIWQWIISGAVIGFFGSCVLMIPSAAMIGNWFAKRAGLAMGIASCASALCGVILSPVFNSIITVYGWRTCYFVEAIIVFVLCMPWALFVFKLAPCRVGACPYGLELQSQETIKKDEPCIGQVSLGIDVPYKRAVRSASFVALFVFAGSAAFLGSGYDNHLPGFAMSIGYSSTIGSLLLSALQLGSFTDKLLMGLLNDKIGVQKTLYIELGVVALGALGLLACSSPFLLMASAFLFGVSDSLIAVSLPLLVRQVFGVKNYVKLYALIRVSVGICGSFASVAVGLTYDITGGFVLAFGIALALVLVGFIAISFSYIWRSALIKDIALEKG